MLTTVRSAPSPTTISTLSARVAEPTKRSTTVARLWAPAVMTAWLAVACSMSVPVRVTKTGRSSSASAGTDTANRWTLSCHTRAAMRSVGMNPLVPSNALSADSDSITTPSGASYSAPTPVPSSAASAWRPRSRLSGVKRQISSRPVGTGWSSTAKEPVGCRWESTRSTSSALATASSVIVTHSSL